MASPARLWLAASLALLLGASAAAAEQPQRRDEVRVLIDVSGSMRQSDPDRLRAPALRLLVDLLPPNSRAGAWLFAQHVNPLVAVGAVDADWRKQALAAADRIHSRGLFTDIGAAIAAASQDWREPDPASRRSIILLTDGMVDVSKQPGVNERARQAVLDQWVPRLQAAGVALHTIALSSKADIALLTSLATATGAGYEQTDDAGDLQRVFLRMFERAVERDTLPLTDNRFLVDPTIEEVTLLVFRQPDAPPTRVQAPDGNAFGADAPPADTRWHSEAGYDLITIRQPASGEWRLLAAVDPDNRAMIVTDLELQIGPIPDNLLRGESLPVRLSLSEAGDTITRAEFLRLLDVRVRQLGADGATREWMLADNGLGDDDSGGDGVFKLRLGPSLEPGEQVLVASVASKTFEREKRQRVRVAASPLTVSAEPVEGAPGAQRIKLRQAVDWLRTDSLRVGARVLRPDGGALQLSVPALPAGGWETTLEHLDPSLDYAVAFEVAGSTSEGRAFQVDLPTLRLPARAAAATTGAEPEPATPESTGKPVNWWLVGTVLATANLALIGLVGLAIYLLRHRRPLRVDASDEGAPEAS